MDCILYLGGFFWGGGVQTKTENFLIKILTTNESLVLIFLSYLQFTNFFRIGHI